MMLARLAFMMRAYSARVGPLDTISMMPMVSLRMSDSGWNPGDLQVGFVLHARTATTHRAATKPRHALRTRCLHKHDGIFPASRLINLAHPPPQGARQFPSSWSAELRRRWSGSRRHVEKSAGSILQ